MSQKKTYSLIVPQSLHKKRLDFILATHKAIPSRSEAQRIITEGKLYSVPPIAKLQPKTAISSGSCLYFNLREIQTETDLRPSSKPLHIVYEDSNLLVINKPTGTVVHPAAGHYEDTLVNQLLYHCQTIETNTPIRPGIVHRIDKETSGLLVVAKDIKTHEELSKQFADHTVERTYHALVWGKLTFPNGIINAPIARHKQNRQKQAIQEQGKQAITHYKLIQSFPCAISYISCQLETGRTHQIRVHMQSIGHGLVGDKIYAHARQSVVQKYKFVQDFLEQTQGQYLHAKTLGFIHPKTGESLQFSSNLPPLFAEFLTKLQQL